MAYPKNVLTESITIKGSVHFTEDMTIDGKIEGKITSEKGKLTIGSNALVNGDIHAGEVVLFGKVTGKIVSNSCELKRDSRIEGDIHAGTFSVEEGASLSGNTRIGKPVRP